MEGIKSFTTFTYKTTDGETITATKNNGIVTLKGDKNGVRQLPLDDFMKELVATVPKLERTPKTDKVSFSGASKTDDTSSKTGGAGRAWASVFIPGLGQFLDGRSGAGAAYLGASIAGGIGTRILTNSFLKDVMTTAEKAADGNNIPKFSEIGKLVKKGTKVKYLGLAALGIATTALWISNIVDAYKGKKS